MSSKHIIYLQKILIIFVFMLILSGLILYNIQMQHQTVNCLTGESSMDGAQLTHILVVYRAVVFLSRIFAILYNF